MNKEESAKRIERMSSIDLNPELRIQTVDEVNMRLWVIYEINLWPKAYSVVDSYKKRMANLTNFIAETSRRTGWSVVMWTSKEETEMFIFLPQSGENLFKIWNN